MTFNSNQILVYPDGTGWFALDSLDLSNVASINVVSGWQEAPSAGLGFELRLDGPEGKLIGKGTMAAPQPGQQGGITVIEIDPITDNKFHDLYFVYQAEETQGTMQAGVMGVQFNGD